MPTPTNPYAKAQVSIAGGGPVTGYAGLAAINATIALSGTDTTGWASALWELVNYPKFPTSWAVPAGWSQDGTTGIIYYAGTTATGLNPPGFTLDGVHWGRWLLRLAVNSGAKGGVAAHPDVNDFTLAWDVASPVFGFVEPAYLESTQVDPQRSWVSPIQKALHAIESATFGGGGGLTLQAPTAGGDAAYTITGTTGSIILPITALTAPRAWQMPTAPTIPMQVSIADARRLYTAANKITLSTAGGTDHFWVGGVDKGTTYTIDPTLWTGNTITFVRATATTWEAIL